MFGEIYFLRMRVYAFYNSVSTDTFGFKQIIGLYKFCGEINNEVIHLNFYDCNWIDANMASLLQAITHKLIIENNLEFQADYSFLKLKFDVLFRNGFLVDGENYIDEQRTVLPLKSFGVSDKDGFYNYLENTLTSHRGMPDLEPKLADKIIDDLGEIFTNAHLHAETEAPFFVCGQFYPTTKCLKFTLVDLGKGFLNRISKATEGEIKSQLEAIDWAIAGNTSKLALEQTPGGSGLKGIYDYCMENRGVLEIISGNGYWSTKSRTQQSFKNETLEHPLPGTAINLFFSKN